MINAIGEATMQHFVRTSYNAELFAKDQEVKKADKVKDFSLADASFQRVDQASIVNHGDRVGDVGFEFEKSDDGQKSELSLRSKDNMKTRNNFEDGQLVVEQYDEDGNLVKKTPPGYLPFGEMA